MRQAKRALAVIGGVAPFLICSCYFLVVCSYVEVVGHVVLHDGSLHGPGLCADDPTD